MEIKIMQLGNNSVFVGEIFEVGANFKIGANNIIRAKAFIAGDNVTIGSNNEFLISEHINIGLCGYIGNDNKITCISATFGEYLYFDSNIIIGHGGSMNYDSRIEIGKQSMICSYVKLNTNYKVSIGERVGIGENVDIWTHGSFLQVLDGFPYQFGPVNIGSDVWIPAKSTIMPNVTIGHNVVFGANSLINKDIPANSLCAGIPVKVLRENVYPKELDKDHKVDIIDEALRDYFLLCEFKEISFPHEFDKDLLVLKYKDNEFDFKEMMITGKLDEIAEDFRDFMRRRGMKFYTGLPFKSILPPNYKRLLDNDIKF